MNKKNVMISIMLMLSLMESVCANDARAIRKDLQSKYEENLLNKCQLMEEELSFVDVLNRDIQIMQDHRDILQRRIDGYNHGFVRTIVPFFKGLGAVTFGSISAFTGFAALSGTVAINDLWNGQGNISIKVSDFIANQGFNWGFFSRADIADYNKSKSEEINRKNPGFKAMTLMVPAAGAISFLSGLICIKAAASWYRHGNRVDQSIAKWQKRIQRDNAIIAILKQLKYNNAQ